MSQYLGWSVPMGTSQSGIGLAAGILGLEQEKGAGSTFQMKISTSSSPTLKTLPPPGADILLSLLFIQTTRTQAPYGGLP